MERFLAWSLVLEALIVVGYMIKQAVSGKRSLICVRNFFLTGLILFQLTSAASMYFAGHYGEIPPNDPVGTGLKYLGALSLYLVIFTIIYETGWFTARIQNLIRPSALIPGAGALALTSFICLCISALCQLVLKNLGLIGILSELVGVAMAAVAVGLSAWAWAGQPRNFVLAGYFVLVLACASIVTLFQEFERRSIVGVMIAAMWGMYYGGFKTFNFRRAAIPLAVIGTFGVVVVAAVTSTRGHGNKTSDTSVVQTVQRLSDANITEGLLELMSGQDAAPNSMWVMENRPEPFPYQTLQSLEYFLVNPIPRVLWSGKPDGLGSVMVVQSMVPGKGEGYSVGPGLIGHIYNDNPWIALPLYAILLAAGLRIMDDLPRRFPLQPLIVVPLGSELGEILGLTRGEMGFFLFRAVFGMSSAFLITLLVARVLRSFGFAFHTAALPEPEPYQYGVDPDEYGVGAHE